MIFSELLIEGAFLIKLQRIEDERGFFSRVFCDKEFSQLGLEATFAQCSLSYNKKRGTLRGMHFQVDPHAETKIVHCLKGAIYDVILDLRPHSKTYKKWVAIQLDSALRHMLYIPKGVAHGFQTLEEDTEIFYQISAPYVPGFSKGVRWDDPVFGIQWPLPVEVISKKDAEYGLFYE
jgi:dTDP-4-dehydrorhamnose 3,5-epimerase